MARLFGNSLGCAVLILAMGAKIALAQTLLPPPPPLPPGAIEPDTTGPLNKPMIASIGPDTYFINEFGANSMFVLVGSKRALVIDSGSGFSDFKAIVESLTSLPYDVAITHAHQDHAGGIGQFDVVYMDPADVPMARAISYEGRVAYGKVMRSMQPQPGRFANVWAYTDESVRKWDKLPEFRPLHDGMVFDLGGRKVTAYSIGNHTPGSTFFIDDKSRIMFGGDSTNGNVGVNDAVSTFLRKLLKVRSLRPKYDRTFTSHTAYANSVNILPQDPQVLDDEIENLRSILRGNPTLKVIPNHLNPRVSLTVAVYGKATQTFKSDKLWEPNEPHVIP